MNVHLAIEFFIGTDQCIEQRNAGVNEAAWGTGGEEGSLTD